MLNLLDRSWKSFRISDLFEISGTITTHPSKLIPDGKTPRVTCAAVNNGLDTTYQNEPTEKGDVLTIDSATIGFVSYQLRDFIATDHVEKLTRKDGKPLGYYTGLFIKVCIDNSVNGKYGYGYKFSQTRIKKQYILVPIGKDDLPDWAFMEAYMRQLEQDILKPTIAKMKERIIDAPKPEGGGKWKDFVMNDLFDISSTRSSIDKKNLVNVIGDYPYITRSDKSNGIDIFVSEQPKYDMDEGNVITIGLDTQTVFYQPTAFYTGQNIHVLRHPKLNRLTASFLNVTIKKQLEKFNWGSYGATLTRLKKSKILLPSTEDGEPDWQYMEDYMKYVEQGQLRQAVEAMSARVS